MEFVTNLLAKAKGLSKKQLFIAGGCAAAVVGVGAIAATTFTASNQDARMATPGVSMMSASAYMEETVSLGDIVVGVSETGTASMYQEEISYDFSVAVEEFYVKAGEDVAGGQALALLDMDAVNELKDALELEIADAKVALADAEADYDLKVIQTEKTLSETLYNGENAEYNYAIALQEIQDRYLALQETVESLETEWWTANDQVLYGLNDDYSKDTLYEARATAHTASEAATLALQGAEDDLTYNLNQEYGLNLSDVIVNGSRSDKLIVNDEAESQGLSFGKNSSTNDIVIKTTTDDLITEYIKAVSASESAESAYNSAASAYSSAKSSYDTAYEKMEETLENVVDNLADAREAVTTYEKSITLYQIDAEADYQTALANYAAAYDVYDNTIATNENLVETAEQTLAQLQTEYEAYDDLPADGIVYATCSGYVMRLADVDTEYNAGVALVTIGSDQSVEIWVSISQDDIADIGIGMETNVIFDAYEEYSIPAVVESISTSSSSGMTSSVNYTMEIICDISDYPDLVVFDSMSATVTFVQRQESGVIMVSSKCVTTENGVSYVKMLDDQGDIVMVEVETGFSDGFDVEIVSGLAVGDVVIIESAVG